MNGTVKIIGGKSLKGSVFPVPNKNAVLAVLPISILSDETIVYKGIPNTTDVQKILKMLTMLGAKVKYPKRGEVHINCRDLKSYHVDPILGSKIRASIMFAGPLLARFGIAEIPLPGGCVLGERSIAAHVDVFKKVGIKVEHFDGYVRFTAPSKVKKSYFVWMSEASVTATENFAMYASGVESIFTLVDAACEPHVAQVATLLKDMGAKFDGIGSNRLVIRGTGSPKKAKFVSRPDPIDIAGYIVAAAVTDGEITIKGAADINIVGGIIQWLSKFNISIKFSGDDLVVSRKGELKIDVKGADFPMAGKGLPKFYPRPWPGFPVDALPPIATLASKTKGRLLLSNWMYESGLDFVRELDALGADIFIVNPQQIIINGPVAFKGGEVVSPSVIQACKAIFFAALADPVETTLHGVDILKRRYPNIFDVYRSLGADIRNVDSD